MAKKRRQTAAAWTGATEMEHVAAETVDRPKKKRGIVDYMIFGINLEKADRDLLHTAATKGKARKWLAENWAGFSRFYQVYQVYRAKPLTDADLAKVNSKAE